MREFTDKPFVLIVSGGGITAQAKRALRAQVEARHGRVVEALELWTARRNSTRFGATEPAEIMRGLGEHLAAQRALMREHSLSA